MKSIQHRIQAALGMALFLAFASVQADSIGDVSNNLFSSVLGIRSILQVICIATGGGMIISSFFRYRTHRRNPIEAPLSSVILLFIAGLCVIGLAFIPILEAS